MHLHMSPSRKRIRQGHVLLARMTLSLCTLPTEVQSGMCLADVQDQGLLSVAEAHCLRALEYGTAAPAKDKAKALLREIRCGKSLH